MLNNSLRLLLFSAYGLLTFTLPTYVLISQYTFDDAVSFFIVTNTLYIIFGLLTFPRTLQGIAMLVAETSLSIILLILFSADAEGALMLNALVQGMALIIGIAAAIHFNNTLSKTSVSEYIIGTAIVLLAVGGGAFFLFEQTELLAIADNIKIIPITITLAAYSYTYAKGYTSQ